MSNGQVVVTLAGNELVAALPDGRTVSHSDPVALAELLLAESVLADQVRMPDWREGDCAPLTGHKMALFAHMRAGHVKHGRSSGHRLGPDENGV